MQCSSENKFALLRFRDRQQHSDHKLPWSFDFVWKEQGMNE